METAEIRSACSNCSSYLSPQKCCTAKTRGIQQQILFLPLSLWVCLAVLLVWARHGWKYLDSLMRMGSTVNQLCLAALRWLQALRSSTYVFPYPPAHWPRLVYMVVEDIWEWEQEWEENKEVHKASWSRCSKLAHGRFCLTLVAKAHFKAGQHRCKGWQNTLHLWVGGAANSHYKRHEYRSWRTASKFPLWITEDYSYWGTQSQYRI